jgi:ABC-type Fe3+ transport system substrate-binding protein
VTARIVVIVLFVGLLAAPFLFRPARPPAPADARQVIVITPHNEQIRQEYARAFEAWHEREHGERVHVVYNVPGGTSEIRKMLEAQYIAALEAGETPGGQADLLFGGGTYEHDRKLKRGVTIERDGVARAEPISAPVAFDQAWLDTVYGENRVGNVKLYDPDGHWFGTALSGFGIVYNRDALAALGLDEPTTWSDLCHPDLRGWVALVNPGQSGSISTAFQAILDRLGWREGWAILRRAGANARYFSGSSLRAPTDVSAGDAAMGVCIDFFGRYQAQAIRVAGGGARIGYVDPPGVSVIDPDPISMLRGAPEPELARRFIEFCLSEEGQALWQFAIGDDAGDGLGPRMFELRRLPVRRSMYERHRDRMIDDVNPYELARAVEDADPNVRAFIAIVFAAIVMDTHEPARRAWAAIVEHPAFPADRPLTVASDIPDARLRRMVELFDAMPSVPGRDGASLSLATTEHLGAIRDGWLDEGWADAGLWPRDAEPASAMRRRFAAFFRAKYEAVLEVASQAEDGAHAAAHHQ